MASLRLKNKNRQSGTKIAQKPKAFWLDVDVIN